MNIRRRGGGVFSGENRKLLLTVVAGMNAKLEGGTEDDLGSSGGDRVPRSGARRLDGSRTCASCKGLFLTSSSALIQ